MLTKMSVSALRGRLWRAPPLPVAEQSIRAQQLRLLFKSPTAPLGAAITAIFALIVLWRSVDRQLLIGWGAAMLSWTVMRYVMWLDFRADPGDDSKVIRWAPAALIGVTMSGMMWGLFGLGFYIPEDPETRTFIIFVMAAMVAGGAVLYAAYLPAHDAYLLTATLPNTVAALWHGTWISMFTGIMLILLIALTLVAARTSNRSITSMIRLQLENEDLVADLRGAKDAAEEASRVKSQFLAHMSHELRTPLNAIIGFSEIIKGQICGPVGNERYRGYATDIHSSGRHLLRLVDDILDLSKLETGNLELSEGEVDLAALVSDCIALVKSQADRRAIRIAAELPDDSPLIHADELRLKQVILNLLSNAIKFSHEGHAVGVGVGRRPSGEVSITVRDTGIGMKPEDIPAALQPFRQVESEIARRYEGTGLGLPLAKTLIELHGGTLALASAPGAGTTVTVLLPKDRVRSRLPAGTVAFPRRPRLLGL